MENMVYALIMVCDQGNSSVKKVSKKDQKNKSKKKI